MIVLNYYVYTLLLQPRVYLVRGGPRRRVGGGGAHSVRGAGGGPAAGRAERVRGAPPRAPVDRLVPNLRYLPSVNTRLDIFFYSIVSTLLV